MQYLDEFQNKKSYVFVLTFYVWTMAIKGQISESVQKNEITKKKIAELLSYPLMQNIVTYFGNSMNDSNITKGSLKAKMDEFVTYLSNIKYEHISSHTKTYNKQNYDFNIDKLIRGDTFKPFSEI